MAQSRTWYSPVNGTVQFMVQYNTVGMHIEKYIKYQDLVHLYSEELKLIDLDYTGPKFELNENLFRLNNCYRDLKKSELAHNSQVRLVKIKYQIRYH